MKKSKGFILHRGVTGGAEFVAIATMSTDNRKTGDMIQIWFLLEHYNPVAAVAEGIDSRTICKACPFSAGRGCYVNVGQAPLSIWRAYHRGAYLPLEPKDYGATFSGRKIRFGAYGNPTLLPIAMVRAIAGISSGWTGYFHDWRTNRFAGLYARYFMASTETDASRQAAQARGFRTFHVSPEKPADAVECLSDAKGLTCAQCRLCAGLTKAGKPEIWINPHGSGAKKAAAVSLAGNLATA